MILFLGLALAPRAFEFRAWPEPSRHEAVEEVVDRPVAPVAEVHVAGVTARSSRREPGGSVRVERRRRPERAPARTPKAAPSRAGSRDNAAGRSGRTAPVAPQAPEIVVETPAPPAEVEEPPAQPAQLADRAPVDPVLRPEPEAIVEEGSPLNTFGTRDAGRGAREGDRKARGRGRHGRGNGHRGHHAERR
ncbi:MAG TPA: hypothetical protein VF517_03040 [Thermoleophilaceae bacterium]